MRTLSSTLSAAQKTLTYDPLWRCVLSRTGQTTQTYTRTRILSISHTEKIDGTEAEIILNNSDGALTSLDFEHYQCVLSYGMNTSAGEEYSATAPMRVRAQELHSGRGILKCYLRPIGILDQLDEDKATEELTLTTGDNRTVKTLISAILGATLVPFDGYSAITVTYDSEDSLIDSFIPKEYFSVHLNESRLQKVKELLDYTGCKMRAEDDGQIHIFDPVISGTTYDYEYKFNVSGDHTFFNKTIRNRFVNPNEQIVKSHPSHNPQFTGSATSATSYALAVKTHTMYRHLASDAQATSIASAITERRELDAERGFVVVPMNVGQELWDYVKMTDSRQNDTKVGNVQYIQRNVKISLQGGKLTFSMLISLGTPSTQSLLTNMASSGLDGTGRIDQDKLFLILDDIKARLFVLYEGHNELVAAYNAHLDEAIFRKLTVTEELNIPSESA